VAIVLLGLFNLFGLLLVAAHGSSLLLARGPRVPRRPRERRTTEVRWLAAVIGAGVVLSPYLVVAAGQSGQLAWVPKPSIGVVLGLISDFSGSKYLFPVVGVLVAIGIATEFGSRRRPGLSTANLALPWLVLPPVVLLAVSLAAPVYVERYVVFCMPATALLTAVGLVRVAQLAGAAVTGRRGTGSASSGPATGSGWSGGGRSAGIVAGAVVLVVVAALAAVQAGPQHRARLTADRPDNLRAVSQIIAAHERPGDGVVFLPWDARVVGVAYPAPFARLTEIGQLRSPDSSDSLRGSPVPVDVLASRLGTVRRVWVVRWIDDLKLARVRSAEAKLMPRLRLVRSWTVQSVLLSLYQVRSG
jgi:mannosyltransferase